MGTDVGMKAGNFFYSNLQHIVLVDLYLTSCNLVDCPYHLTSNSVIGGPCLTSCSCAGGPNLTSCSYVGGPSLTSYSLIGLTSSSLIGSTSCSFDDGHYWTKGKNVLYSRNHFGQWNQSGQWN